jgi:hypothetical protein
VSIEPASGYSGPASICVARHEADTRRNQPALHMDVMLPWLGWPMYQERYDPLLHPDEIPEHGSTLSRILMISAVVSGTLCVYLFVKVIA